MIIYDIITESSQQNIDGLLLLIDFEKLFNSISWDFITNTIKKMNFSSSFVKWVDMFHLGSTSKIILYIAITLMLSPWNEDVGREILYLPIYFLSVPKS